MHLDELQPKLAHVNVEEEAPSSPRLLPAGGALFEDFKEAGAVHAAAAGDAQLAH